MLKVFISYRRDDSAYVAALIRDHLVAAFGEGSVFMDVDNIPLGVDFRDYIAAEVFKCDILIALIGDRWLDPTADGLSRRIDNPSDLVRIEIESALRRGIPVVPVLVEHATMPGQGSLPESLQPLKSRNAAEVRPGRMLKFHLESLTKALSTLPLAHAVDSSHMILTAYPIERVRLAERVSVSGSRPRRGSSRAIRPILYSVATVALGAFFIGVLINIPGAVTSTSNSGQSVGVQTPSPKSTSNGQQSEGHELMDAQWPEGTEQLQPEHTEGRSPSTPTEPLPMAATAPQGAATSPLSQDPAVPSSSIETTQAAPALLQECGALERYTPDLWQRHFIHDSLPETWMVYVADGGKNAADADEVLEKLRNQTHFVAFEVISTIGEGNKNERYAIVVANGLPDRKLADRIVWLARNCGIATDAYKHQQR